ncbi:hypothetical protein [Rhizobium grahamii]|uniref:Uncharacterized protein n=1 Tax=Rhizobium grahamii CCGE 502 TaxID=990285 RepID=S3HIL4_9HYPH|nr:hypothetical protein [Rhizobium grahamii]EPE98597.1 hypothetical protein RGCCGE502_09230 [Rhizobium grahamii CCGE 502]
MSSAAEAFAAKHDIAATGSDVARIRNSLQRFYEAVAAAQPVADTYVQQYHGDSIRAAFLRHNPLAGQGHGAAVAMAEMPSAWPTKYRASVAYHLSPLLEEVVNS